MFYVNSYPRSGNTWIRLLLTDLLGAANISECPLWRTGSKNDVFACHPIISRDVLNEPQHRHIVKTHGKWHTCKPGAPIIYLVRDGRDALYSYYHYNCDHHEYKESWDSYFERQIVTRRMVSYRESYLDSWMGNWAENVESYQNRGNVFIVKYEDLLGDTVAQVSQILAFLDITGIDRESIKQCVADYERKLDHKRKTHSRRRGTTGVWKRAFSGTHNQAFCDRFGSCLTTAGYLRETLAG